MIQSPNDWLNKAGAHINKQNMLILPHIFLLVPLAVPSEAIQDYTKINTYPERLKKVQAIAINVRTAETAFFKKMAIMLNKINKNKSNITVCHCCVRNDLFETNLKTIRREINEKILHKMDNGKMIDPKDFHLAFDYYEEIFKLPLIDPVRWGNKKIQLCEKCFKKNKKAGVL